MSSFDLGEIYLHATLHNSKTSLRAREHLFYRHMLATRTEEQLVSITVDQTLFDCVSFKQRLKRHQFAFTSGLIIINTRLNNELQQRESSRVTCLFALSIIKPLFCIHRALRRAPHGF